MLTSTKFGGFSVDTRNSSTIKHLLTSTIVLIIFVVIKKSMYSLFFGRKKTITTESFSGKKKTL